VQNFVQARKEIARQVRQACKDEADALQALAHTVLAEISLKAQPSDTVAQALLCTVNVEDGETLEVLITGFRYVSLTAGGELEGRIFNTRSLDNRSSDTLSFHIHQGKATAENPLFF
jgi:hypothetical protein